MQLPDLQDQLRYAYDPQLRGLHHLMARRVRTILMVSNPYEAFSISRDHSLTQDIYGASQLLHLQNVPQVFSALSGEEGLKSLGTERFDLVLVSSNLPDMTTSEFGRKVKARNPGLPVVMVVFDGSWYDQIYRGAEPEGIDRTFAWRGSADVLLSIMKLVEDSQNVDRDLSIASIGIILVIEDAVEHYSLILPHLYSMLMRGTFRLVPEGINESERQVRTRVRPKVLLARTFCEAAALFEKYETSLVGIISDRDLIKASVIEESVEKTDMSTDAGEDAWMWDRVMQTINKYYTISRIQLRNILVREAMVPPITAFKKNGISESAALMHKNRIDQMPVITPSQKLMGMLKDSDILKALIDHCEKDAA